LAIFVLQPFLLK